MSKGDWPGKTEPTKDEQEQNLRATDPAALKASVEAIVGDTVARAMADMFQKHMKEAGADKTDRRYLRFPEIEAATRGLKTHDVMDRTPWNELPGEQRGQRRAALNAFFRQAIFKVPVGEQLGSDADPGLVRALSTTNADGGYLIPPGFIPEITRDIPKISQLFQFVRRIPVAGDSGEMPAVGTNASVTWGDTEGSAMTDNSSSVTFGQNTYTVKRMNAMVKLSREIVSDANPDIVTTVVELFQEAIARENDKVIAIGSGTGRPTGLYSASGITNVTITSLTYANIVKLKHSVDIRYHSSPSFRWTMNQNVLAALMQVVDGNGLPIFVDGGVPINGGALTGRVSTILGVPYSIEASLPNNYLGIGDLRYYCWFDRQQLAVESTMEGGDSFAAHQMWIKFTQRCDGKPILPVTKPMARTRVLAGVTSLV